MPAAGASSRSGARGDAARVFAALGDPVRLRVIGRLCAGGPLSIRELAEGSDISRQAITKHLQSLERAGLLRSLRAGRQRIWQLQPRRLAQARTYLETVSRQWDQALERLRAFVEG
ncbi:MAG TPA: metalloregulator ArsR/SmtB family transcription factor [Steroidobacteraceae bacterium]|nr:metalloregulator ArsR/SmtB family transcription factor [Steroidobacteraceae bacterium]